MTKPKTEITPLMSKKMALDNFVTAYRLCRIKGVTEDDMNRALLKTCVIYVAKTPSATILPFSGRRRGDD